MQKWKVLLVGKHMSALRRDRMSARWVSVSEPHTGAHVDAWYEACRHDVRTRGTTVGCHGKCPSSITWPAAQLLAVQNLPGATGVRQCLASGQLR